MKPKTTTTSATVHRADFFICRGTENQTLLQQDYPRGKAGVHITNCPSPRKAAARYRSKARKRPLRVGDVITIVKLHQKRDRRGKVVAERLLYKATYMLLPLDLFVRTDFIGDIHDHNADLL